jgi:MFS family permease
MNHTRSFMQALHKAPIAANASVVKIFIASINFLPLPRQAFVDTNCKWWVHLDVAALYVLYPYLTIHMRELGINVEETAIMSAVIPVVAIVMPPIAGMVADRIGNFRVRLRLYRRFSASGQRNHQWKHVYIKLK